jgi:hypothetical protein
MDVVVNGSIQLGISVNGLRMRREPPNMPAFPTGYWSGDVEVNVHRLVGQAWEIVNWDAALTLWPCGIEWRRAVKGTLQSLIDEDCIVAWLGSEGFLCDPPHLFDPECMASGVLAALTASGRFICPVDPCEPFLTLTDEEMLSLREEAAELAMSR